MTRLGGQLTQDVDYSDWRLDAAMPESMFETPRGVRPAVVSASASPSAGARSTDQPSVRELGGGLFSVEGIAGYRVLFQEFQNFVVIFEAPQNDDFSLRILSLVREKIPAKPVRYVALTHHHSDHAGGFRTYVAEKIVVITTPGNVPYFLDSYRSRYTIAPDTLTRNRHPELSHHLDAVQGGRDTITNGDATVELIDIGPSPHADEMLVFWFPRQRVLFQGDLWNREADGTTRPANDTTMHFAQWLQKSGLPVEQIIGVHGPFGTPAELQEAVRLRKAQK